MRGFLTAACLTAWLLPASAGAQVTSGPSSEPITPPGYAVAAPGLAAPGQGVPVLAVTAPGAGPRVELREHETSIRGVWIPALIALPLSWIFTWAVASTTTRLDGDAIEFSYIPLVGPWLMLGESLNGQEGYYIAAGVFQGASAIALVLGLVIRRTVREQVWVAGRVHDVALGLEFTPGPGGGAATISF